jgi:thiamine biosynthesis lipoprotein ApbE
MPVSRHPLLALALLAPLAGAAQAPANAGFVFTCVANGGRTITADRPIAECMDREQRVLRRDGSLDRILAPPLTAEQRAAKEARERLAAEEKRAQTEAVRRDRNLLQRYPDRATHDKAREASLRAATDGVVLSERRLAELAAERKPIVQEAEFYTGKPLPPKLRQQFNANDGATEAQRAALQNLKAEVARVNAVYDSELERLNKLWAGVPPGSVAAMAAARGGDSAPR